MSDFAIPYSSDELIPISSLQHYLYCPRQCALIYMEAAWQESRHTAEGRLLHKSVHEAGTQSRGPVRTVTELWLKSLTLGLTGQADMVEFHRQGSAWRPYPVEYKRGRPKSHQADLVQLCAQALCLEEMLGLEVPEGAMFYGQPRRRLAVVFDQELRRTTRETIQAVRELLNQTVLPDALDDRRCRDCSLLDQCMPAALAKGRAASGYLEALREEG